ncbi:MAG TPA: hypothetical protein VF283_15215 [Bryobacteraceae bacterium]
MRAISIRNLPEETYRTLKLRAAQHGRSAEAEIRAILEAAVRPKTRDTGPFEAAGVSIINPWRAVGFSASHSPY